ncbi:MAG TPA: NAD(P)-dependent oxidoreductase, partial [Bacteroidia bacterium]|nr:NAD(P)-dependent oxidoreductase [Bacteroidia bacterium]
MSKKILANDGIDTAGKALLEKAGYEVITEKVPQDKLITEINSHKYVGITVRSATKVRKDIIDACSSLKFIARGGVGMDNIDVEYAKEKGLHVINTPAASSHSVAELVFAHLFGAVRFLYDANRRMPVKGETEFEALKKKYSKGIELKGKTIGIVGFGRIGQEVAKIALGLGMKVIAHDPFIAEAMVILDIHGHSPIKLKIETTTLDKVLEEAHFISLHVPGGKMIGADQIAIMKKGVILVNASRGGVIDEHDLIEALNSGQVAH